MPKKRCTVTAILTDGTRDTIDCVAASVNCAVFAYINARLRKVLGRNVKPLPKVEITPDVLILRTTLKSDSAT